MTGSGQHTSTRINHLGLLDSWGATAASLVGLLDEGDRLVAKPVSYDTSRCDRNVAPARLTRESQTVIPAGQGRMSDTTVRPGRGAVSDSDTAWELAAAAKPCLTDDQRLMVFVEIGSGENYLAIKRILTAVVQAECAIPAAMVSRLTYLLDAYRGSPAEQRLRELIVNVSTSAGSRPTAG